MNLNNISTEDLVAELDQIISDAAEWMERAAHILVELRKRRVPHPLFRSDMLRFFKGIAGGQLSVKAVMAVGGNANIVRQLAKLPKAEQEAFAMDRTVQVIEITDDGDQILSQRNIKDLSQATMNRVFDETGLRSIEAQKAMLGSAQRTTRIDGFLVNETERWIKIGNRKVKPLEMSAPLKALGYRILLVGAPDPSEAGN